MNEYKVSLEKTVAGIEYYNVYNPFGGLIGTVIADGYGYHYTDTSNYGWGIWVGIAELKHWLRRHYGKIYNGINAS